MPVVHIANTEVYHMTDVYYQRMIVHNGRRIDVAHCYDHDHRYPWLEADGHGVVHERPHGTSRALKPGQKLLNEDWVYDVKATMQKARAEGWGVGTKEIAKLTAQLKRPPTKREISECAVQKDLLRMSGWLKDEWHWMGVVVTDVETGVGASLWGIESDCEDYIKEVEVDLAEEIYVPSVEALLSA